MSRMQIGLIGGGLLLAATFATTQLATRADDPAKPIAVESKPLLIPAMSSPQIWPPGKVIFEQSETEKKIRATLEQATEIEFLNTQLGDVVQQLKKRHEINIELDTEALAADGKGSETPITKSLRDTTLNNALRLMLDGQGLTTLIKNDVLLITTRSAASLPENLIIRLYQVHDLVVAPNDPTASQPDFDSLIEIISSMTRPADWQDNGGTIGNIKQYVGPGVLALIVVHDKYGHEEIEGLLKSLRAARLQPIYDAQAQQPLPPPPSGAPSIIGHAVVGDKFNFDPEPAKAPSTKTTNEKPATPAKSLGGGYF
jgi:hypothetical protein